MSLYVMQPTSPSLVLVLSNQSLSQCLASKGISLEQARRSFTDFGRPTFELSVDDATISTSPDLVIPDVLFWSWIPIFSTRARNLFLETGSSDEDFVFCQIGAQLIHGFLHLPEKKYDVVNIEKSIFQLKIPTDPPFFHHMTSLEWEVGADVANLPPIFRVPVPETEQVLAELFVKGEVVEQWDSDGFTGAQFRRVHE